MSRLVMIRDSGSADLLRAYRVVVDGHTIAKIGNGASVDFEVPSGRHQVAARIDWCGSKTLTFTVAEHETAAFRVRSNLRGLRLFLALWYVLIQRDSYLVLERDAVA